MDDPRTDITKLQYTGLAIIFRKRARFQQSIHLSTNETHISWFNPTVVGEISGLLSRSLVSMMVESC